MSAVKDESSKIAVEKHSGRLQSYKPKVVKRRNSPSSDSYTDGSERYISFTIKRHYKFMLFFFSLYNLFIVPSTRNKTFSFWSVCLSLRNGQLFFRLVDMYLWGVVSRQPFDHNKGPDPRDLRWSTDPSHTTYSIQPTLRLNDPYLEVLTVHKVLMSCAYLGSRYSPLLVLSMTHI